MCVCVRAYVCVLNVIWSFLGGAASWGGGGDVANGMEVRGRGEDWQVGRDRRLRCQTDFVPSFLFFFFFFPGSPHRFPTDEVEKKVPCNKSKLK